MSGHSDGAAALHQRAQKFMDTLPESAQFICVLGLGKDLAFSMHGCSPTQALELAAIALRSAYTLAAKSGMSPDESGAIFDAMLVRMTAMTEREAPVPSPKPNPARN